MIFILLLAVTCIQPPANCDHAFPCWNSFRGSPPFTWREPQTVASHIPLSWFILDLSAYSMVYLTFSFKMAYLTWIHLFWKKTSYYSLDTLIIYYAFSHYLMFKLTFFLSLNPYLDVIASWILLIILPLQWSRCYNLFVFTFIVPTGLWVSSLREGTLFLHSKFSSLNS